jgi:hypothetical protein
MIRSEATRIVEAAPEKVYAVFSDYEKAHPAILPKPYFDELTIEEGGQGAGTILRVTMKALGVENRYRLTVTEPEPGRRMVEADAEAGVETTFLVEPQDNGRQSQVTIRIDTEASPGLMGQVERLIVPPYTRRILNKELQLLADYLANETV